MEVAKNFCMNFYGAKTRARPLEFQVTEKTIAVATKILFQGEKWFKGMDLDPAYYNDYLKP
jgi:hypothetical protein